MKREASSIETLCKGIQNEVLRNRIKVCLAWYIERAVRYKNYFCFFSVITIVLPSFITIINTVLMPEEQAALAINAITVCSVISSFSAAILTLFKFQEKWILYRSTAEEIKKELSLYQAGRQKDKDIEKLIIKLEQCMSKERSKWQLLSENSVENENKPKIKSGNGPSR